MRSGGAPPKAWMPQPRCSSDMAGTSTPYARPGQRAPGGIRSHRSHSDHPTTIGDGNALAERTAYFRHCDQRAAFGGPEERLAGAVSHLRSRQGIMSTAVFVCHRRWAGG